MKSDAVFLIFYPYLCSRFKKQYGKEEHRFIINPISGTQSKDNIIELISQHLDQDKFNYQIARTEYAGHATLLAQEHVEKVVMRLWLLGATVRSMK